MRAGSPRTAAQLEWPGFFTSSLTSAYFRKGHSASFKGVPRDCNSGHVPVMSSAAGLGAGVEPKEKWGGYDAHRSLQGLQ